MRFIITKEPMSPDELAESLARTPRAAAATLERLKALNPHLADTARIPKGGVLILPDGPDIKPGAGTSVGAVSPAEVGEHFSAGVRAAASRAAEHLESLTAERAQARDALKGAAAKRLVESDPQLRKQLAAADAEFKAAQKLAKESQAELAKRSEEAQAEFARLHRFFG